MRRTFKKAQKTSASWGDIELGYHPAGFADDSDRSAERSVEGVPQDCAGEDEEGIGHAARVDADDILGVEKNPHGGGGDGRQEEPGEAEQALAVLRPGVAEKEPPRELPGLGEVADERDEDLTNRADPGDRGDDAFGELGVGCCGLGVDGGALCFVLGGWWLVVGSW